MTIRILMMVALFVSVASSCREAGDDDTPGMQSSKGAAPAPKTDGRQETLVPGSRNHPAEGSKDESR